MAASPVTRPRRRSCRRAGSRRRGAWVVAAAVDVGGCIAVAGEGRVERPVGVVARRARSPRAVGNVRAGLPATTILPLAWIATARPSSYRRSRWSACRRPRRTYRASRRRCSGRARSHRRRRSPGSQSMPATTILPSGWIATSERSRRRRSRWSACRRPRSGCRASRRGCSGPARSPSRRGPPTTILPSAWIATAPQPQPPKSVVCLPSPAKSRVERAVGVVAGQREVAVARSSPATTILPSAWIATPSAAVAAAEVGGLLAVAREGGVERAVGVVAGQREVAAAASPPPRSCRRPGWRRRGPDRCRRSRSSACRRPRTRCRASRPGCSGPARSRSPRRPTTTILPSAWIATPGPVDAAEVSDLLPSPLNETSRSPGAACAGTMTSRLAARTTNRGGGERPSGAARLALGCVVPSRVIPSELSHGKADASRGSRASRWGNPQAVPVGSVRLSVVAAGAGDRVAA